MRRHKEKENKRKRKRQTVRERFADGFEGSLELVLDVAKITLFGTKELTVENYLGVTEYEEKTILLQAKPYAIRISGDLLEIKTMSREIIYISGNIRKFEYEK